MVKRYIATILLAISLSGCAGAMLTLSGIAGGLSIANSAYSLYDTYLSRKDVVEDKEKK